MLSPESGCCAAYCAQIQRLPNKWLITYNRQASGESTPKYQCDQQQQSYQKFWFACAFVRIARPPRVAFILLYHNIIYRHRDQFFVFCYRSLPIIFVIYMYYFIAFHWMVRLWTQKKSNGISRYYFWNKSDFVCTKRLWHQTETTTKRRTLLYCHSGETYVFL